MAVALSPSRLRSNRLPSGILSGIRRLSRQFSRALARTGGAEPPAGILLSAPAGPGDPHKSQPRAVRRLSGGVAGGLTLNP